jgi:2-polyprenyl-3-methyl-5-hydroxy-6-metoxy-1,4-benzoquinol methylase
MNRSREAWQNVTRMEHPEGFTLGPINAGTWLRDPKHIGFMLARYKFAAKMLRQCSSIIEVGCGEGLGSMLILQGTQARMTALDFDEAQIAYAQRHVAPHGEGRITFRCGDLAGEGLSVGSFDGLLSLDVLEHVHPEEEQSFLDHCVSALQPNGVAVVGTPNLCADAYASEGSRRGHINLFDPDRFTTTLERHFAHVFLFSMNDEMVHTGFAKMAHYLLAVCVR